MKIIAVGSLDKLFVEISTDEVCNLLGFYSTHSDGAPRSFKAGDEIKVGEMYKRLSMIGQNQRTLERYANELRGMASRMAELAPIIHAAEGGDVP